MHPDGALRDLIDRLSPKRVRRESQEQCKYQILCHFATPQISNSSNGSAAKNVPTKWWASQTSRTSALPAPTSSKASVNSSVFWPSTTTNVTLSAGVGRSLSLYLATANVTLPTAFLSSRATEAPTFAL